MRLLFISEGGKKTRHHPTQHSFYLKLLQAKPPIFISAFQGSPPPNPKMSCSSSAPAQDALNYQWCMLSWLTGAGGGCSFRMRALLRTAVTSKQKTLSFHSLFTLPRIKNGKQRFSESSSESKFLLFIDSQVS